MLQILDFTPATLATLTPRSQKHGDEEVPAVSLGLVLTVENTLLDGIDPDIRLTLFRPKIEGQGDIPGVDPSTPVLRCNSIDSVKLPTKYEGWTLEVDDGIDDTTPQVFGGCKVDKFSVEPKQGGSCLLRMRVGTSDLDAERSGFLGMHVGQSIWIKLRAPEKADEVPAGDAAGSAPDATDLFLAGTEGDDDADQPAQEDPARALFGEHAVQDEEAPVTREDVFPASNVVPVTTKKRRKLGEGLGTDEEQAARQAAVLAQDPSMAGAV